MSNSVSSQSQPLFASGQIIALDHLKGILYGETIETIPQRQMCWMRGIAISFNPELAHRIYHKLTALESNSSLSNFLPGEITLFEQNSEAAKYSENSRMPYFRVESDLLFVDLHRSVDLLLPSNLFRVAFDTELIPILSKIDTSEQSCFEVSPTSKQCLNWFLQEIWHDNPDQFQV